MRHDDQDPAYLLRIRPYRTVDDVIDGVVLIVEDEIMLAMLLEDAVAEAGHEFRRAARLSKAMDLARDERFDAAVLDVNLNNEPVFPLAALLRECGVPFLFASGYGSAGVPPEYSGYPVLQKPYSLDAFHADLHSLVQAAGSGCRGNPQFRADATPESQSSLWSASGQGRTLSSWRSACGIYQVAPLKAAAEARIH